MANNKRLIRAKVTLPDGRVREIEMHTDPWVYDSDIAKLQELYGTDNVEVLS